MSLAYTLCVVAVLFSYHTMDSNAISDPNLWGNTTEHGATVDEGHLVAIDLVDHTRRGNSSDPVNNAVHSSDAEMRTCSQDMATSMRHRQDTGHETRNAIIDLNMRWPNGVIPYVVSTSFTHDEKVVIGRAMMEFHKNTCIRFVPRINQQDYLILKSAGSGCNSLVGRVGGSQIVSLDQGCIHVGLIVHELMHATGFYHEQCRTDRDNYVTINWDNIQDGRAQNFDKLGQDVIQYLGASYDIGSVMHYEQYAFAKDPNVPTISAKNGGKLGNSEGFSPVDIMKINRLYQCSSITTTTTSTTKSASTPTPVGDCVDANAASCAFWSAKGKCTTNADLMASFCSKACGFCPSTATSTTTKASASTAAACVDSDTDQCPLWAQIGECSANPVYMLAYCQLSCNSCP